MKTRPIASDSRYTITKEFCGYKEARFVARFCDEWIGQSIDYPSSVLLATGHRLKMQGALIIEAIPA